MGSSREYWQYAKECARWAAEAKQRDEQELLLEMVKAWTNIALVETDVTEQSARGAVTKSHQWKRAAEARPNKSPGQTSGRG
jgi:hypothetical protein